MLTLPLALTACASRPQLPAPPKVIRAQLIEIPADLRKCVEDSGVEIPARALTVAEIEALWKQDRVQIVVKNKCLARAFAFYNEQKRRLAE